MLRALVNETQPGPLRGSARRPLVNETQPGPLPGGARWRYVWGSCLAFVFSIQLITGILLMTAYSPSSSQAWSSVHFIQYQMDFGWLIRGLHHFGSQTMMVLIGLHMLQVVIAGAHLPPREINWWLGMGLFGVTFGLGLTGYLLPWDQKGYWATRVATNIAGTLPGIGPDIQQLLVGGEDYGNHTLTRFYALHVGILPFTGIVLIILHILIFRRHGVTSSVNVEGLVNKPENEKAPGTEMFWPRQAFYDMLACMVIFGDLLSLVFYGHGHPVTVAPPEGDADPGLYEHWAKAGTRGLGANLDAAADRQTSNYPARPEWYFLFLFQLLKYFEGEHVLIGTVIIPNVVVVILILLPLFGIGPMRKVGHYFGVLVIMTLFIMVGMLTLLALKDDEPDGVLWGMVKHTDEKALDKAKAHQHSVHEAEEAAKRACQLAMAGVPVDGGHVLLRNDPLTRGPKLFQAKCGICHSFSSTKGDLFDSWNPKDKDGKSMSTASDLGTFGSKEWMSDLFKNPMDDRFFGLVKKDGNHALTRMRGWRAGIDAKVNKWEEEKDQASIATQEGELDLIAEWLSNHGRPKNQTPEAVEFANKAQAAFFNKKMNNCQKCHTVEKMAIAEGRPVFTKDGNADGPDLSGYGSADWIRAMIVRPGHATRYGETNLMPAFRPLEGPGAELAIQEFRETHPSDAKLDDLADIDRELIIRFIRRDYRPVRGGTPIK